MTHETSTSQNTQSTGLSSPDKYRFYSDGRHGWLRVPMTEISRLGIAPQISGFSYMDKEYAYLEEDADMSVFFTAIGLGWSPDEPESRKQARKAFWAQVPRTDTSSSNREIFVRRLPSFDAGSVKFEIGGYLGEKDKEKMKQMGRNHFNEVMESIKSQPDAVRLEAKDFKEFHNKTGNEYYLGGVGTEEIPLNPKLFVFKDIDGYYEAYDQEAGYGYYIPYVSSVARRIRIPVPNYYKELAAGNPNRLKLEAILLHGNSVLDWIRNQNTQEAKALNGASDEIKKQQFTLRKVNIDDLTKADKELAKSLASGKNPLAGQELIDTPIIVGNVIEGDTKKKGVVLYGYDQIAQYKAAGKTSVPALVSVIDFRMKEGGDISGMPKKYMIQLNGAGFSDVEINIIWKGWKNVLPMKADMESTGGLDRYRKESLEDSISAIDNHARLGYFECGFKGLGGRMAGKNLFEELGFDPSKTFTYTWVRKRSNGEVVSKNDYQIYPHKELPMFLSIDKEYGGYCGIISKDHEGLFDLVRNITMNPKIHAKDMEYALNGLGGITLGGFSGMEATKEVFEQMETGVSPKVRMAREKAAAMKNNLSAMAQKKSSGGDIKAIRTLGTGSNVYFENDFYRVNDGREGVYLLINRKDDRNGVPVKTEIFNDKAEAVFVAEKLNKIYPSGVPEAVLIGRVISDIRKEYGSGNTMATGGEVYAHKHISGSTIKLIEPTSKGWKVEQTEEYAPFGGKKLRTPKVKTAFFSNDEINSLFTLTKPVEKKEELPAYDKLPVDFPASTPDQQRAKEWLNKAISERGRKGAEQIARYNLSGKNANYHESVEHKQWLESTIDHEEYCEGGNMARGGGIGMDEVRQVREKFNYAIKNLTPSQAKIYEAQLKRVNEKVAEHLTDQEVADYVNGWYSDNGYGENIVKASYFSGRRTFLELGYKIIALESAMKDPDFWSEGTTKKELLIEDAGSMATGGEADNNPFKLYGGKKSLIAEATTDIKKGIKEGKITKKNIDGVPYFPNPVLKKWEDVGATDTASREAILEYIAESKKQDGGSMADGGEAGQKKFLHIYKLTDLNGNVRIETMEDVYMPAGIAFKKMYIDINKLKAYKYNGVSETSDEYKKFNQLIDSGKSKLEAYNKVFVEENKFRNMATGGSTYMSESEYRTKLDGMSDEEFLDEYEYETGIDKEDVRADLDDERRSMTDDLVSSYKTVMKSRGVRGFRSGGGMSSQLEKGIEVEKEHKDLYERIKKMFEADGRKMPMTETEFYTMIAKGHIREDKYYYDKLLAYVEGKKMEVGGFTQAAPKEYKVPDPEKNVVEDTSHTLPLFDDAAVATAPVVKKEKSTIGKEDPSKKFVREIDITLKNLDNIPNMKIHSSHSIYELLQKIWDKNSVSVQERSYLILLDRAMKVIGYEDLSKGGVAGTVVDPKIITALASKALASSAIIAHNHPSGNLKPSDGDIQMTRKIKDALRNLDVALLDHIIIVPDGAGYFSFADEGML